MKPLYSFFFVFSALFLITDPAVTRHFGSGADNRVADPERHEFSSPHMGTLFRVSLYASNEELASTAADSAFRRVEVLNEKMSDYLEDSELNRMAETAGSGKAVRVSKPLFEVLERAQKVSEQTGGAFDITAGPLVRIWRSIREKQEPSLPDTEELQQALEVVGYQYIHLDGERRKVRLDKPGMQLDLGGIAKGYAAGEMKKVFAHFGLDAVLINAGGDMVAGAAPPDQDGWRIAVTAHDREGDPAPFVLNVTHSAVSTSGDLYQYVEIDGERYSHIVDPRTGYGITEQRTVTVVGDDATLVDAYSTALSILPVSEALEIIEKMEGYEVYLEVNDNGAVRHFETEGFRKPR